MNRGQLLLALIAALAVGAVAYFAGGGDDGSPGGGSTTGQQERVEAGRDAVRVSFAYSPEKEKLLLPLIDQFNRENPDVFIEGRNVASGAAQTQIAAGRLKIAAWSPASSLWGRLLNFEADQPYAPDESPSIVRTPLVIAMWEPMARALGWPQKKIGFKEVLDLARSEEGWAQFGRPEFGRFKLVHTNPDYSTSGLSAVVAEYYAATGKKEGLLESDVNGSKARRIVKSIERSIVHYGDTTLFIAEQMKKEGPGYASAVAMEEVTLLDFNRSRGSRDRLIALYPPEGTFYSDSPFIVLNAPWVTAEQKAGAERFQAFLAGKVTPQLAAQSGFRPAALDAEPVAPITEANGVDPAQPERVLALPEPRVLSAIKKAWREDRKAANVLLVLDTSGSMAEEQRLDRAKQGLKVFFQQTAPQDRIGLMTFSDRTNLLLELEPFSTGRRALEETVGRLIADGGTAFFDAALEGFELIRDLDDRERINAVVLLTDGEDTDSVTPMEEVVRRMESQGDTENRVRVFTIAYSSGATGAREQLKAIAEASGGQGYEGTTEDIESVYRSISSFF